MDEFYKLYTAIYESLYADNDCEKMIRNLSEAFDNLIEDEESSFFELLKTFNKYRQDVISSDREAAAFVITLMNI